MVALNRIITLKQNTDFRRAYARGRSYTNPALVLYCIKSHEGICRVGIKPAKNRQCCRAKPLPQGNNGGLPQCCAAVQWRMDLIFVARFKTKHMKSTEIERIMTEQSRAAGVVKT